MVKPKGIWKTNVSRIFNSFEHASKCTSTTGTEKISDQASFLRPYHHCFYLCFTPVILFFFFSFFFFLTSFILLLLKTPSFLPIIILRTASSKYENGNNRAKRSCTRFILLTQFFLILFTQLSPHGPSIRNKKIRR